MKKIAVLMSTYNGEKYLREQIDSILAQKCEYKIDLIVRDDGSTDSTIHILDEYKKQGKLILYLGENIGTANSFINMIKENLGYDYYAFSDQDDIWKLDKLQRAVNILSKYNAPMLYCSNAIMCDYNMNLMGRNVHRSMKFYNNERSFLGLTSSQGCTCVFNKELAFYIQNYPIPKNMILHDTYLTSLCYALSGVVYADEYCSMYYRIHSKNIGGYVSKKQSNILTMIKKRISYIINKPEISFIEQDKYILKTYGEWISNPNKIILNNIINSKKFFGIRLRLCLSRDLRDESLNLDFSNRIKILLNNY